MMRWIASLMAMLLLAAMPASAQEVVQELPPPATDRVALETSAGRIVLEIETDRAPVTAANFLRYVDNGRLDGTKFYRVVKVDTHWGFVQFGVQGERGRTYPPIAHEPTTRTGLTHSDGTITVARREPGTAQGEFVIVLGDQSGAFDAHPEAEGDGDKLGNAAFGRVVEGMDVLLAIFDAPVSETATVGGTFQGQVPEEQVTIIDAERVGE
ncbi:peptidylprolyl isomerase [Stakelama tenebrarum]|uniref:peptidylprolyl isomerase n=1 Tax=Stakelama tenebrarum TaxID=2711215 RepID=A0A6G6Y8S3_9SPHN|nr:peptidylprolyl isomerase [Sphingosinithalassobacter tenebrarum]QIG80973.1 peptidylprolyl isomerase [Sphingosinithalassobacter tenebrarum]